MQKVAQSNLTAFEFQEYDCTASADTPIFARAVEIGTKGSYYRGYIMDVNPEEGWVEILEGPIVSKRDYALFEHPLYRKTPEEIRALAPRYRRIPISSVTEPLVELFAEDIHEQSLKRAIGIVSLGSPKPTVQSTADIVRSLRTLDQTYQMLQFKGVEGRLEAKIGGIRVDGARTYVTLTYVYEHPGYSDHQIQSLLGREIDVAELKSASPRISYGTQDRLELLWKKNVEVMINTLKKAIQEGTYLDAYVTDPSQSLYALMPTRIIRLFETQHIEATLINYEIRLGLGDVIQRSESIVTFLKRHLEEGFKASAYQPRVALVGDAVNPDAYRYELQKNVVIKAFENWNRNLDEPSILRIKTAFLRRLSDANYEIAPRIVRESLIRMGLVEEDGSISDITRKIVIEQKLR